MQIQAEIKSHSLLSYSSGGVLDLKSQEIVQPITLF